MHFLSFIPAYLAWHYGTAFRGIFLLWGDTFWFVYNFFSVSTLLKTFFAPWKRIHEEAKSRSNPSDFFSRLIINTMMRAVGALIRSFLLFTAVVVLIATLVVGILFLILWPVLPIAAVGMIIVGAGVLVKNFTS